MRAILHDRAAYPTARLLLFERRFARAERLARIEPFISVEVVDTSVEVVRPRARDGVEDDAARVSELRGVLVRDDLKLLDGIGRRARAHRVDGHQFRTDAIDERLAAAARLATAADWLFA